MLISEGEDYDNILNLVKDIYNLNDINHINKLNSCEAYLIK